MFKLLLPIMCLIGCYSSAQTSFNPALWNLSYSDEFNSSTINPEWNYLQPTQPWGSQTFSSDPKYVSVASDGTRSFLNLKAYVENVGGTLKKVSGGLVIPDKVWDNTTWQTIPNPVNPFFYGYYEIEAKLTIGSQGLANNSIWPAFWTIQSGGSPGSYWYEEMDIFEPGSCYVKDSRNVVHYWTLDNPNDPNSRWYGQGYEGEASVNMQNWHTYGLLWMPDRIVYYQDGQPFHTSTIRVPTHQHPALLIDLQTEDVSCAVGNNFANQFVGSFQINYFRYYTPKACNLPITEIIGNNYNFTGWVNSPNNVREYCRFKNTTTPASSNIQVFSEDVYLISNFEVPAGASFEVIPEYCD